MKKISLLLVFLMLTFAFSGCGKKDSAQEKDITITFGVTPWTSTVPPTYIAMQILENEGYTVKKTNADVAAVFMGLSRGDVDVFMDAWLPMHQVYLDKFKGKVTDTAVSYSDARVGWVVPANLEDINSVQDIKGKENLFENKYYGIEEGASATKTSREMIESYGLDMEHVSSSEGGMMAQAIRNINRKKPVVFFGWRPHTMFRKYNLKILDDDKGFFETSTVHVITNSELKKNAPEVYKILSNWSISIGDIEEMISEIEDKKRDPKEVAGEWISKNQDKIKKWLK
jgi:glycine betaine/proline transport system substrate-binding protein